MSESLFLPTPRRWNPRQFKKRAKPYCKITEKSAESEHRRRLHCLLQRKIDNHCNLTGAVSLSFLKYEDQETILVSPFEAKVAVGENLCNQVLSRLQQLLKFNPANSCCPSNPNYRSCFTDYTQVRISINQLHADGLAAFRTKNIPYYMQGLYFSLKKLHRKSILAFSELLSVNSLHFKLGNHYEICHKWQLAVFSAFALVTMEDHDALNAGHSFNASFSNEKQIMSDILQLRKEWGVMRCVYGAPEFVYLEPTIKKLD